jgi:hypothetical protein
MVVMIDEVKLIFYSVLVGKGARESVLWLARLLAGSLYWKRGMLSHALARAAIRRLALYMGCIMIKTN